MRAWGAVLAPLLLVVWLPAAAGSEGIFRDAAAETGLAFRHFIGATGELYLVEVMGSGVALLDYDGDGDLDVYFLQGTVLAPGKTVADSRFPAPSPHWPGNRLFRNDLIPGGELRFTDVTEEAGVGGTGYGLGATAADYDNDGDVDLYVTAFGPNALYRNEGDGTFKNVAAEAGVRDEGFTTSAAFLDYDADGDLDLYVAYYNAFSIEGNKRCKAPSGERDYCGPTAYFPLPDRLYRNDGNGRFTDVSRAAGIAGESQAGLGVVAADLNLDGWIDLYVADDQTPNLLWMNGGDGTFEESGLISGSAYNENGEVEAGMGVSVADFDGDGDDDLFLTHLRDQTNTLYLNDGDAMFDDATSRYGLDSPSVAATGFGTRWFDYDNDGRLDLFAANGSIMRNEKLRGDRFPYHEKNQLFHNEGERFRDVSGEAGAAMQLSEVSRGAAFGDIDNDGDIDIVVSNCNGPARLLLNEVGWRNPWLRVELEGVTVNRDALGARVALLRPGRAPVWRRVAVDGSYLSASEKRVHFGLGKAPAPEAVLVVWPDGSRERWPAGEIRRTLKLRQGEGTPGP